MGLMALTHSAVTKLRIALGDLAVDMTLRTRVQQAYTPGEVISYTNTDIIVKAVVTRFKDDEVDGTLIRRTDALIIVFPPASKAIPKPNDVLIHGLSEYRVINNNPVYAGSEIAFSLVQARPPV